MQGLGIALTFDDVRLKTGYSEVMPKEVSLETRFSRNIHLKIPIVSAAMDTVTEYEMAIELAKLGGIGIIHRGLTPEEQARQVARVKFHLNGLIDRPICVNESQRIEEVLRLREEKGYTFHTFPVINGEGRLVGILTKNDFDFCDDKSRLVREIMSAQLVLGKPDTTLEQAYKIMIGEKKKVFPLVDESGSIIGMYIFSDVQRIILGSSSTYNVDSKGQLRVGAAVGVGDEAFERLERLVRKNIDIVVIDTAHGDSSNVIETTKRVKEKYPNLDVVAGNISEPESAERLIKAGADGIKIGQGPGSICTTRYISGTGCPQVTAVYNCSRVADVHDIPVCADGGLVYSGDIAIAIGAGAHSVMLGNMLAGTKETPRETIFHNGRYWKNYRGMGSLGALEEHAGSRERYRQEGVESSELVPEGIEGLVPYKGELRTVLTQYIGGLRSGMGYVGAHTIQELREKADFWRISRAGRDESHPHNILITREPPNYPGSVR